MTDELIKAALRTIPDLSRMTPADARTRDWIVVREALRVALARIETMKRRTGE